MNAQEIVKQEPVVLQSIKKLQDSVQKSSLKFADIEERLLKVSHPQVKGEGKAYPNYGVPVADEIQGIACSVDVLIERMQSVLDRLEL
jgi:hypothetical protein